MEPRLPPGQYLVAGLVKGPHTYLVIYHEEKRPEIAFALQGFMLDPELDFDFRDVGKIVQASREQGSPLKFVS
jgi:hypothetical protein